MTNGTCVDWSTTSVQLCHTFYTGHPNIHLPHSAIKQSLWFRDWFGYQFMSTSWQPVMPELALQHNGGNIQHHFLHKPLERVYLSVGTHPYQQHCSNTPRAEESQGERKDVERERERGRKRGSLQGFDMHSRTYMVTPPANAALLEHICVWDRRGLAYERRGVNSSPSTVPWDPFCCL